MATVKVRWTVSELANVMSLFDEQKVYRSDTQSGTYNEITGVGTRVALVADQTDYYYDDVTGDDTKWYKVSYHNSSTLAESSLTAAIPATGGGTYATIQDVRDEGITTTEASDARVLKAIKKAEAWLERTTGRWFYARNMTNVRVSGTGHRLLPFHTPIIQIDSVEILSADWPTVEAVSIDLDTITVYNRHLTMGLTADDDRDDPRLAMVDGEVWPKGKQNILLQGWFGYTELAPEDTIGESSTGSQIPISMGATPVDVEDVILRLVMRSLPLKGDPDEEDFWTQRHRVSRWKTRDQEIQLLSPKSAGGILGQYTGDPLIDSIVAQLMSPATGRLVG